MLTLFFCGAFQPSGVSCLPSTADVPFGAQWISRQHWRQKLVCVFYAFFTFFNRMWHEVHICWMAPSKHQLFFPPLHYYHFNSSNSFNPTRKVKQILRFLVGLVRSRVNSRYLPNFVCVTYLLSLTLDSIYLKLYLFIGLRSELLD